MWQCARRVMTFFPFAAVILAAGRGTRMNSRRPKVMHPLAGRPILRHLLETAGRLQPQRTVVVVGPDMGDVAVAAAPVPTVEQAEQRGTADAVKAARANLADYRGAVVVLYGDTPLVSQATITRLLDARAHADAAVAVLGFRPRAAQQYGRLVVADGGSLDAIVEARDATQEQLDIALCNSGVMAIDGGSLFDLVDRVGSDNAKGEFYLTDIVALARERGQSCLAVEGAADELMGINSRAELAAAEALVQADLRAAAMAGGATLIDPNSVWLSHDTVLGEDVVVHPSVVFGPGAAVAAGAEIRSFSHLEGAQVAVGAIVGPYARLRPGARVEAKAHVGNFVEVKNAVIGAGAKANHLSYIGDADIGAKANIGAGTITCNYDGFAKHHTHIGAGAFIGSNTALVAPISVGDGAIIGAGSTLTRDVADDALALTRAPLEERPGYAAASRERKRAAKTRSETG